MSKIKGLFEIWNETWKAWLEYEKALKTCGVIKIKFVRRKDPDQERILQELGIDEYLWEIST